MVLAAVVLVSPTMFAGSAAANEPLPDYSGRPTTDIAPAVDSGVDASEVLLWVTTGVLVVLALAAAIVAIRRYQHHHPHVAHPV